MSEERAMRASAVEFLDSLIERDVARPVIPLLDDPGGQRAAREGAGGPAGREITTWPDALAYLIAESNDPDLAAPAVEAARHWLAEGNRSAAEDQTGRLRACVEAAAHDESAPVRDAAEKALRRRGSGPEAPSAEAPSAEESSTRAALGEDATLAAP